MLRAEARENQQTEPDTVLGMKLVYLTFHMQRATGRKNLTNRNEPSDETVAKMLSLNPKLHFYKMSLGAR